MFDTPFSHCYTPCRCVRVYAGKGWDAKYLRRQGAMTIIQRRVFFAKAGQAEQLVAHIKEMEKALSQYGVSFKSRMMTDYMSGRTDRIVMEWEVDDLKEIESNMDRVMSDPQAQASFAGQLDKLNEMIHYAEVENWMVR